MLELKCDQCHLNAVGEISLQAKLSIHSYGIFIPPAFFNEEATAVQKTAVQHDQFLNQILLSHPILHPITFEKNVAAHEKPPLHYLYTMKETSQDPSTTPSFLFTIEASKLSTKTDK